MGETEKRKRAVRDGPRESATRETRETRRRRRRGERQHSSSLSRGDVPLVLQQLPILLAVPVQTRTEGAQSEMMCSVVWLLVACAVLKAAGARALDECTTTTTSGAMCDLHIDKLRPTQYGYGPTEVTQTRVRGRSNGAARGPGDLEKGTRRDKEECCMEGLCVMKPR